MTTSALRDTKCYISFISIFNEQHLKYNKRLTVKLQKHDKKMANPAYKKYKNKIASKSECEHTLTSEAKQSCPVTRPLLSLPDKSTHSVPLLAYVNQHSNTSLSATRFMLHNTLHLLATYMHQRRIQFYTYIFLNISFNSFAN